MFIDNVIELNSSSFKCGWCECRGESITVMPKQLIGGFDLNINEFVCELCLAELPLISSTRSEYSPKFEKSKKQRKRTKEKTMSNFTKVMWLVCPSLMALLLFGAWQCSKNPGQPEEPVAPIVIESPWAVTVPNPVVDPYALFGVHRGGLYEITSTVLYEPASELNESFYLVIWDSNGERVYPESNDLLFFVLDEHNAGFEQHLRDCGVWELDPGEYTLGVYHLSVVADMYPALVVGDMGENESVAGDGFTLTCVD